MKEHLVKEETLLSWMQHEEQVLEAGAGTGWGRKWISTSVHHRLLSPFCCPQPLRSPFPYGGSPGLWVIFSGTVQGCNNISDLLFRVSITPELLDHHNCTTSMQVLTGGGLNRTQSDLYYEWLLWQSGDLPASPGPLLCLYLPPIPHPTHPPGLGHTGDSLLFSSQRATE